MEKSGISRVSCARVIGSNPVSAISKEVPNRKIHMIGYVQKSDDKCSYPDCNDKASDKTKTHAVHWCSTHQKVMSA
jgi:hypothetical protein